MKRHLLSHVLLLASVFLFFSCQKEEPEPEDPGSGSTLPKGDFKYSVNGGASITADSAVYYPSITTIYSYKNGTMNTIEMNLSALDVGSYTIAKGNKLTYTTSGTDYVASTGAINITSKAVNSITGDFNTSFSTGTITSISGNFSDIGSR